MTTEMAGNLADVCPVGALLQKPQAFETRPWELRRVPGIDVMDAVGSNIRFDVRQRQVMRILPRVNDDVNEEWISDKTRHHVDALVRNRLDRPWVREKGKLREARWSEALDLFAEAAEEGRRKRRRRSPATCSTPRRCMRRRSCCRRRARPCSRGARPGLTYDTSSLAAVEFQLDHRGHRGCRRRPAGRVEPAVGSAAGQHAAAQGRSARARRSSRSVRKPISACRSAGSATT